MAIHTWESSNLLHCFQHLSFIDDELYAHSRVLEFGGENLATFAKKMDEICKSNMLTAAGEVKRKKNKDLTWNYFCKAVSESTVIDLEEIYLPGNVISQKKLKFLNHWIKQIEKSRGCCLVIEKRSKPYEKILKEIENRLADLPLEIERPIPSSASVGGKSVTGVSRIQDGAALVVCSEPSEIFVRNLPNKIQGTLGLRQNAWETRLSIGCIKNVKWKALLRVKCQG